MWYEHHVISGNYRLGELQGALLNASFDRLEDQTKTRDDNGQYLEDGSRTCPAFIRNNAPTSAPDTHTISSCCHRCPEVSRAPRRDRGVARRGDSLLRGLRVLAPATTHVSQPCVRPLPPRIANRLDFRQAHFPTVTSCAASKHCGWSKRCFSAPATDIDDIYRASKRFMSSARRWPFGPTPRVPSDRPTSAKLQFGYFHLATTGVSGECLGRFGFKLNREQTNSIITWRWIVLLATHGSDVSLRSTSNARHSRSYSSVMTNHLSGLPRDLRLASVDAPYSRVDVVHGRGKSTFGRDRG